MKREGIELPLTWGHVSGAVPRADDKECPRSKYFAGRLTDLAV
jgi:hypothetical protein